MKDYYRVPVEIIEILYYILTSEEPYDVFNIAEEIPEELLPYFYAGVLFMLEYIRGNISIYTFGPLSN